MARTTTLPFELCPGIRQIETRSRRSHISLLARNVCEPVIAFPHIYLKLGNIRVPFWLSRCCRAPAILGCIRCPPPLRAIAWQTSGQIMKGGLLGDTGSLGSTRTRYPDRLDMYSVEPSQGNNQPFGWYVRQQSRRISNWSARYRNGTLPWLRQRNCNSIVRRAVRHEQCASPTLSAIPLASRA